MISAAYHSRRRRGYMLMVAIALVIILGVLVSALHHYEVVTRRALSGDEADILLVQARKWEMGKALKKLPSSLTIPPQIIVANNPAAVANEIYVTDNMGQNLFSRDGNGAWNGFPNLVVKRIYQIDPAASSPPAPPNFKEYRGTPRSPNPNYEVYRSRIYRQMTGDFLNVAALAPTGSISLDGCAAWPNPDMDDIGVNATQRFSGLPVCVAAGTTATVTNVSYGTVYAGKSIAMTNSTLALPLVGPLPISDQIAPELMRQVDEARIALSNTAQTLDNKTLQISGQPPTISNIVELIFTDALGGNSQAVADKMLGWLSIRSALEFPFISLPGFATMAVPGTYFSFQLWFHGPFASDSEGYLASGAQTPSDLAEDLSKKVGKLQTARSVVNYMLAEIQGGKTVTDLPPGPLSQKGRKIYEPEGGYDAKGDPVGAWKEVGVQSGAEALPVPRINKGLKIRGTMLQADLQSDLKILQRAKADGNTAAVTTGLKTNQSLLGWMADYQGYLYDDTGALPLTGVDSNLGLGVDNLSYDLKASGTSPDSDIYRNDVAYPMLNQGLLRNSKAVFAPLKDYKGKVVTAGGVAVRDVTKAPIPYFGDTSDQANQVQSDQAISESQWKTILDSPDKDNPNPLKLGSLDRQLELFSFLTSATDPSNPFNKVSSLEQKFTDQLSLLDKKKSEINMAISAERFARTQANKKLSNLPKTRKEERGLEKYKKGVYSEFQAGKGLQGYPYLHYGISFDVLWNAISFLADQSGGDSTFWSNSCPLIWWGTKENDSSILTDGALNIKATFTVPQARTFYYEHAVSIRGDLWMQRGSTLVVAKGDLDLQSPYNPAQALLTTYIQALDFLPSGRIFMEEGSSIVVQQGNLYCAGPVIVTGQPRAVRPISTALIVPNGDIVLRHGVAPGLGLSDILQSPDLQPSGNSINKNFLYPLTSTIFPNMGKVYPFGPFHRRLCYFSKNCAQYACFIFIGPFGIPIPLVGPWPLPRANLNVTVYRGLSLMYAIFADINLGENLYPASDFWPFGSKENCGIVPILPKVNLSAFDLDTGLTAFFNEVKNIQVASPADIASFFGAFLKRLDPTDSSSVFRVVTDQLLVRAVATALSTMVPSPFDQVLSPLITSLLPADDSQGENPTGQYGRITDNLFAPFSAIADTVSQFPAVKAFKNSLMHEVTGVLVCGRRIFVGYKPPNALKGGGIAPLELAQRPILASGLFLASGNININAEHTVGAIISSGGSINEDKDCHTHLLFYPPFTRASLYQPGLTPKITSDINGNAGAIPQFLVRAMDVEYGAFQSSGAGQKGLDVYVPNPHLTAQGWEQQ